MDLQIEGRHVDVTPELTSEIQSRVADLHPGHEVTHIRVTLTKHDHRKAEDSYDVLLVVQIPGHTVTARKQQDSFEEARSEERRVGKECRSRWSPDREKKKKTEWKIMRSK